MMPQQDIQIGLRGLADFSRVLATEFGPVYGAYERGDFRIPPGSLRFIDNARGFADIQLSLVRGELPFMPPEPYGSLSLRISIEYASAAIINALRVDFPAMALQEIRPERGYLRLIALPGVANSEQAIPRDMCLATPIFRDGGEALRLSINTSIASAEILAQMILQGTLAAQVFLEYELAGVCARHAVRLAFDAGSILNQLEHILNDEREIDVSTLRTFLEQQSALFDIEGLNGLSVDLDDDLMNTLLDRFINRFAVFIPRIDPDGPARMMILAADGVGNIEWDLSLPARVSRMLALRTPVLKQLGIPLQQRSEYIQRVVMPSITAGIHRIQVYANLASRPLSVFMMGAHLSAPAVPPNRLQPVNRSLQFNDSSLSAELLLPLSVLEPLQYRVQGFISIETNRGVLDLRGTVSEWQRNKIQVLAAEAFGAKFIRLSLDDSLAQMCSVQGFLAFTHVQQIHKIEFKLSAATALITLAAPETSELSLKIVLTPETGASPIVIEEHTNESIHLDLNRFSEYGPHSVQLHCPLSGAVDFCEVECAAETLLDDPQARTRLIFFAESSGKRWHWFAQSPFEFGYCYRLRFSQDQPFGAWSAPIRDLSDHWIILNQTEIEMASKHSFSKSNQVDTPENKPTAKPRSEV